MAITKNPLVRYRILNSFFKDSFKNYTIDMLLKELNKKLVALNLESDETNIEKDCIKLRQLRYDIVFMESKKGYSIQLDDIFEGKKRIYRYTDVNFSIENAPLTDSDIEQIQTSIHVLAQFEGMPQFEGMEEIIAKLKTGLKTKSNDKPIIGFDRSQDLKGIERFSMLYNAVKRRDTLEITYKDFKNDEPYNYIFHPYYLKEYNNRWFLFGLNADKGKDWNVAIDRIETVSPSSARFINNDSIDWKDYFSDIIGVTRPENASIEEVVLHFNQRTGLYMANKSIHETQKHKWINNKTTLELKIKVILNYELERLILSYGESVKVIFPLHLQNTIKNRLKNGLEQY